MWNEEDRLAALRRYDILDTPPDAVFDDVIAIAAEICGTSKALVSFVDQGRQWFAAEQGFGIRETPIEVSVCAHAIRGPGFLVVPDLAEDARFSDNPLVTGEPKLRFYGGAVLETSDGLPLGTLCVLDDKPRPEGLLPTQLRALRALARQVMTQLELRRALQQRGEALATKDELHARTEALLAEKNAALADKDLLMQEVHHRVKNSLSTVQSLLQMQARMTAHKDVADQLTDSANRIRSFSAMHETLYRVGAAAEVDLQAYFGLLLEEQRAARSDMAGSRAIVLHARPTPWPSADTPTLGLILTELVTNAAKYGAGTISVTLDRDADEAILTVEDEGTGLPADFEPAESKGFGMRIVTGLLRQQQRGRFAIDRSRGHTCFVARMRVAP